MPSSASRAGLVPRSLKLRRAGRPASSRGAGLVGPAKARLTSLALLLAVTACSNHKLTSTDAQRLVETSARFSAPDTLSVRSRYCSTVNAPSDNPAAGLGRLKALEGAGAIRIEHRAAGPGECAATPGPMREWLILSLTDVGNNFHPRALPDAEGWEFTLATRRFISVQEITFNSDSEPTIARAAYRWAWRSDLLGQLLQTSEEPVNAQATFIRPEGPWIVRDVGF